MKHIGSLMVLALVTLLACGDETTEGTGAGAAAGMGGSGVGASGANGGSGGGVGGSPQGGSGGVGGSAPTTMEQSFATHIGGGAWERVQSAWIDPNGDILLCGSTKSSDFPTTAGAYDTTYNGGGDNDSWVAKVSADGTQLLWSTFLSGSMRDDCYGVMSDAAGFVYVTGWTRSTNFPTTTGAYDETHNGEFDIFVAKLDPTQTGAAQLVYGTFVGGGGIDQCRGAMAVDATGVVYFAGYSDSTNFPTTGGAVQATFQGGYGDAVVGRLSADFSNLDYGTYLGSSGPDTAFSGVWLNNDGSLSVVGLAGAANFPVTGGVYQDTFGGSSGNGIWYGDAFASRMTIGVDTATVHFTTFVGGSGDDVPIGQHAMTGDDTGIYIFANTDSTDLETSAGAYQTSIGGTDNLYVAKVSYDGTSLMNATYIGGDAGFEPSGIKLTASKRILLGGSLFGSVTATTMPVTSDAAQPNPGGADEGFFTILSADMTAVEYGTYVGGSDHDRVRDVALVGAEGAVVIGDSFSSNFPTTAGCYQPSSNGDNEGHVAIYAPAP